MPDAAPKAWELPCQLSMLAIAAFFKECGTSISGMGGESAAEHASAAMEAALGDRPSPSQT